VLEQADELVGSEVTRFELLAGIQPAETGRVEEFFGGLHWLSVDEEIAREAGNLARRYRPSHSGIDDVDYLLAATALAWGISLLTTNIRHFPMLPGLEPAY
jgi:predicted nucleic acid-binding protein